MEEISLLPLDTIREITLLNWTAQVFGILGVGAVGVNSIASRLQTQLLCRHCALMRDEDWETERRDTESSP